MRKQLRTLLPLLVLFSNMAVKTRAEEPFVAPGQITNAALVYWQAFAFLPDLDEDETKLLQQAENDAEQLDKAKPLLSRTGTAINITQHVQPEVPCRWEMIEDGPGTLLPHLGKARLLARLIVLQAKLDVQAGEDAAAADHLASALLVARNVDGGVLVQMLVGDAIESKVIEATEDVMPELDEASLQRLSRSLAKLPARPSLGDAIRYERDIFAEWMRPVMTADADQAREKLKQLGMSESAEMDAILAGSKKERSERFDEFVVEYGKLIEAGELPLPAAKKEFQRLEAALEKSSNPLVRMLMPAAGRAFERHTEVDRQFAMLQDALRDALMVEDSNQ